MGGQPQFARVFKRPCRTTMPTRRTLFTALAAGAAALALGSALLPLQAQERSTADGIAEYRKMLEDGNPAELFEAKGEDLWKRKRGPC